MRNMTRNIRNRCQLGAFVIGFSVMVLLCLVPPSFAVKTLNVSDTGHNLSSGTILGNFYSDNESEVCVFCHTPHNANVAAPLWNQYSTTMTFTLYSSGTTETNVQAALNAGLPVNSLSRLCLSCHEGTTGLNTLANPASTVGNPTVLDWDSFDQVPFMTPQKGVYLSSDLSTMHPIGFDYNDAVGDNEIKPLATAEANGVKFYGGGFLECSTCHDPHVDSDWNGSAYDVGNAVGDPAYRKFLRIPNTSSALCMACHNK